MDPELRRLEGDFEKQIDRWLSKQGIFFQLKHASSAGSIFPKICALFFRLFLLLIIALGVMWFYLTKRPASESFQEKVGAEIQAGTNASSIKINSMERYKGGLLDAQLKISDFQLGSSPTSFFEDWYVKEEALTEDGEGAIDEVKKQLSAQTIIIKPFGIADGTFSKWSGKNISLGILNCHLKTGAETDEKAMESYRSIFKKFTQLTVNNIHIEDANIGWGYDISKGSIQGASIDALRRQDVWYLTVVGGTFSHGWLKNAKIDSIVIECHKNGLVKVVEANLRLGSGRLNFEIEFNIKAKPEALGSYEFKGVEVLDLVGSEYKRYLDGKIKGKGTLKGTLNSADGITTNTQVTLEAPLSESDSISNDADTNIEKKEKLREESYLIVRDKFPLLRTMQRLNGVNSYHLLKFNIGGFTIQQSAGDTTISDIDIRSGDFLIVNGAMKYAWENTREVKLKKVDPNAGLNAIQSDVDKTEGDEKHTADTSLKKSMVKKASGELRLGFVPQVFENHPEIIKQYPEDVNTLRVWLPIPLEGKINKISSEMADTLNKIVQQARDKKENL